MSDQIEDSSEATLQQYQAQLDEVEKLLDSDPTNEEFLQLKKDVLELIALTKQDAGCEESQGENGNCADGDTEAVPAFNLSKGGSDAPPAATAAGGEESDSKDKKPKKKKPISDTFEIPQHLVPLDSDSEAIKNKKRRTIKNLKRQWKGTLKDAERETRQQSWQDFAKKGKKRKGLKESSIWSTTAQAGVGVVATTKDGASRMTDIPKRTKLG